jgi:uncharacterized RDD family membrane protein YckC
VRAGKGSGPRAGFWRRFVAFFVDSMILLAGFLVLYAILDPAIAYVIYILATFIYFAAMEGGASGQTLGKKLLGIRVIDFRAGGPIGFGRGLLRQIGRILSGFVLYLGYLWMLWDSEKQTWHDKIATTVVVPLDAYPVR